MLSEEQMRKYEMFKRVMAFFEMNKDKLKEYPEIQKVVEEFKNLVKRIDDEMLNSSEMKEEEETLVKSMNTLINFAKQFGEESKN